MKKKTLIHLIELMIAKYEAANDFGEITFNRSDCPLCNYINSHCHYCILPDYNYRTFTHCISMLTWPKTIKPKFEKKDWQLRLKFWETALIEIKQIKHPGFFKDLTRIRQKLARIDYELFNQNNKI